MVDIHINMKAHDVGAMFGSQAAKSAFHQYAEKMNAAETEEDLLETMGLFWSNDELLIRGMFKEFPISMVKEGWTQGFLDTVYPLRHLA